MPDFMLQEIKEQPAILQRLAENYDVITNIVQQLRPITRIYLTGCGDPYFAALTSRYYIEKATNIPTTTLPSMDFRWMRSYLTKDCLVISSSVSGRTKRTIEATKAAKSAGALTIGITDNIDSPLTTYCDYILETNTSPPDTLTHHDYTGYQYIVPQTKTYTAVLFMQMALGFAIAAQSQTNISSMNNLKEVGHTVQNCIGALETPIKELGIKYADKHEIFTILGSGPYYGLAKYGGAKFLEFALPCYSQCLEEFNHQEAFLADNKWLIILTAADEFSIHRSRELAPLYGELDAQSLVFESEFHNYNNHVDSIGIGNYPDPVIPFVYAIPFQLIAFFIAKAKDLEVDEWCGGKRTDLIMKLSKKTIRASEII